MTDINAKIKTAEQTARDLQLKAVDLVRADIEASHTLADALAKTAQPTVKTNAFQDAFAAFQAYGQSFVTSRSKFLADMTQAVSKASK